jgi:hypothetical protein
LTQGSSCLATVGWRTQSLQDCPQKLIKMWVMTRPEGRAPSAPRDSISVFRLKTGSGVGSIVTGLFQRNVVALPVQWGRWAALILTVIGLTPSRAEIPTVDYIYPDGGQAGTNVTVSVGGKLEPWPLQVWTDHAGLTFKPEETKGKFKVEIAANAPIGPHLVRFYNQDGASPPRCFMVGHLAELSEKEPNDSAEKSQSIEKLPVTLNGRLEKSGDVDSFALTLKAGQWLVAAVDAYALDSPMDPVLQLLDPKGTKVAFNHDGRSLDPFLIFQPKESGVYTLQLFAFAYPPGSDVRFTGGDAGVYRLSVSTGPYAKYSFPAGIQRGRKSAVHLFGWNLGSTGQAIVRQLDASGLGSEADHLNVVAPGIENVLSVPVDDLVEERETEPNNARDLAQPLSVPGVVDGRIDPAGDEDRFVFVAAKGEAFRFQVKSTTLGFPLDAFLKLEDQTGKELARSDDSDGVADPSLNWTAPADGSYFLAVGDLIKRGGSEYVYRLELTRPTPDFRALVDNQVFRLEPGKTAEMKVNVTRVGGFQGSLAVIVEGLPTGVTANSGNASAQGGEVKLTLTAAEDAKPANQPVRVVIIASDLSAPRVRVAQAKLKGKNAAAGGLLINQTESIWLTVIPKPHVEPKPESKAEEKK